MPDYLDDALSYIEKTSISYPQWLVNVQAGKYPDMTVTNWWKFFDAISRARKPPMNIMAPSVSGTALVGQTLVVIAGTWK